MSEMCCSNCPLTRAEHRLAEAAGEVHHEFSDTDGVLVPLKKGRPEPTIPPAPPSDPVLRLLLVEKGLVTGAELDEMATRLRSTGFVVAGR